MAEGEVSTLDLLFAEVLAETDSLIVNTGGVATEQTRISVLRVFLQTAFAGLNVSGKVIADIFSGSGAELHSVPGTGPGGTASAGTLTIQCNDDDSTPGAKIVFSKGLLGVVLGELDENGFRPAAGIPYTHADDAIPFAKSLNLQDFEFIRSKTITEMQRGKSLHYNGINAETEVPNNVNINFNTDDLTIFIRFRWNGGIEQLVSKRNTSNDGYQIETRSAGVTIRFDAAGTTIIATDETMVAGRIYSLMIRYKRGIELASWVLGDKQLDTAVGDSGDLNNTRSLFFGADGDVATEYLNSDLFRIIFWNKAVSVEDCASWASNHLRELEFKEIGASQTELNTQADATADNGGTEANSVGNWTNRASLDVMQSQGVTVAAGSWALEFNANAVPAANCRATIDLNLFNLEKDKEYRIKYRRRHIGSGGSWTIGMGDVPASHITNIDIETVLVSQIAFTITTYEFVYDGVNDVFICKEDNGPGDGGIYFDDFSVKAIGCIEEWSQDNIYDDFWFASQNDNHGGNTNTEVLNKKRPDENKGTWTPTQGTFGTWTAPLFDASYVKKGSLVTITAQLFSGTIDPGGAGKIMGGLPFIPIEQSSGVVTDSTGAVLGNVVTNGVSLEILFGTDFGPVTDLIFSLTFITED